MALSVDECAAMVDAAQRNNVQLLCGQTFSMHPGIQAMRALVASGKLGRLVSVNSWLGTDWLLKPRVAEELDEARGGGVLYRHGPHLVDTVRLVAGGKVRSVRASVGRWMPERGCAGNFSAFLEFEDGTPATISYNGYGYFDTSELTWGLGSRMYSDAERPAVRREMRAGDRTDEESEKDQIRFGVREMKSRSMRWFGLTVASCERGDVRQSPNGLYVYDDDGRHEIEVGGETRAGVLEMQELRSYLTSGTPIVHDGRWGLATLEACMAISASSEQRNEVSLSRQCAVAH
jgi:phthalate 4,5-cis-dihydrodiol dehydrogenase